MYHTNFHKLERDLMERELETSALRYLVADGRLAHAGAKFKQMVRDPRLGTIFSGVADASGDEKHAEALDVALVCI